MDISDTRHYARPVYPDGIPALKKRLQVYERHLRTLESDCDKLRVCRSKNGRHHGPLIDRHLALNTQLIGTLERGMAWTWRMLESEVTRHGSATVSVGGAPDKSVAVRISSAADGVARSLQD